MAIVDYNSFVYKEDLFRRFEDYSSTQMNNYFIYFLDKRLENVQAERRKSLFNIINNLYALEAKYINNIKKYLTSNFILNKKLYLYLSNKARENYLKNLYDYLDKTRKYRDIENAWNDACTIVSLIWTKRIQESFDSIYPGKYIVLKDFTIKEK